MSRKAFPRRSPIFWLATLHLTGAAAATSWFILAGGNAIDLPVIAVGVTAAVAIAALLIRGLRPVGAIALAFAGVFMMGHQKIGALGDSGETDSADAIRTTFEATENFMFAEAESLAAIAGQIAALPLVVQAESGGWTEKARLTVFKELDRVARDLPSFRRKEGIAIEILGATGDLMAWWGEIPAPPPGRRSAPQIYSSDLRLYLTAKSSFGTGVLAAEVRISFPVGREPGVTDRFGAEVPFQDRFWAAVGEEVYLQPAGTGYGRLLKSPGKSPVGRAEIPVPSSRAASFQIRTETGDFLALSLVLFLGLGLVLIASHVRRQCDDGAAVTALVAATICVLFRAVLLSFDVPGRFLSTPFLAGATSFGSPTQFGLLRSPVELLLTTIAVAGATLAMWRWARGRRGVHRKVPAPVLLGFAVIAGAVVTHRFWWLCREVAVSSNVDLFDGPSPVGSLPVSLLEFSIAVAAATWLLALDGLRRLVPYRPPVNRLSVATLVAALAFFCCSRGVAGGNHYLWAGATAVLAAVMAGPIFQGSGGWIRQTAAFVGAVALLTYPPLRAGQVDAKMVRIETESLGFAARGDSWKRFLVEETMRSLQADAGLADRIQGGRPSSMEKEAISLWLQSGLARFDYGCDLRILDGQGGVVSRFSIDIPDESAVHSAFLFRDVRAHGTVKVYDEDRSIAGEVVPVYTGAAPFFDDDGALVGVVLVSLPHSAGESGLTSGRTATSYDILRSRQAAKSRPGPESEAVQVVLYNGDRLVTVSDSRPPVTGPPDPEIIAELGEGGATWKTTSASGRRYHTYYASWNAVSNGTAIFALPFRSPAGHLLAAIDIVLRFLVYLFVAAVIAGIPMFLIVWLRGRLEHFRWEPTFQEKLVVAFLAMALLPALLLGGAGRRMVARNVAEASEREAQVSLDAVRLTLDQETILEAEELARSTFVRRRVLGIDGDAMVDLELGLKRFAIFSPSGELILQNGRVGEIHRAALSEVRNRRAPVTSFSSSDELSIDALVPIVIEGFEQNLDGILLLSRPIDKPLTNSLAERLGSDISFYRGGRVDASTRSEFFEAGLLSRILPAHIFASLELGGEKIRFIRERIADVPYFVGYSALRDYAGNAVGTVAVPLLLREGEASEDLRRALAAITYLTFCVLVVVVLAAEAMGQRIAKPVADLSRGLRRVASGDLGLVLRSRTRGEIGRLVDAYNRMTRDLRRSRRELTERTRFIETILKSIGAGVIAYDTAGNLVSANPAAERILGRSLSDRSGGEDEPTIGEPLGRLFEVARSIRERGEPHREDELEVAGPHGRITLRVVATRLTDQGGEDLGSVVIFEDLTALIQSKKLVAWGEMARQVAHEIKNPLTPMKLSAQQIRQAFHDRHERFPQILDESTELIIEEIESLRKIATEFSAFARMPRREIAEVPAAPLLREVCRLYADSPEAGNLSTDFEDDLPNIAVDREEFRRVLINLLENAAQATDREGSIVVRATVGDGSPTNHRGWEIWESTPEKPGAGKTVIIEIEDDGPGVSDAARGKLFEPNFSTKTDGTGLGLAISRAIVEGYGGAIIIGSTPGRGAIAHVILPVAPLVDAHGGDE